VRKQTTEDAEDAEVQSRKDQVFTESDFGRTSVGLRSDFNRSSIGLRSEFDRTSVGLKPGYSDAKLGYSVKDAGLRSLTGICVASLARLFFRVLGVLRG
jgi:hypothetical protein